MGYEISFKIKEYDDRFKSTYTPQTDEELLVEKAKLVGYCLYPEKPDGTYRMHSIANSLSLNLRYYVLYLVESWKASKQKEFNDAEPDEEGYREFYFCGRSFSHEDYSGDTIDNVTAHVFEELFIIVITPTPDRFVSEERDRYDVKLSQINELIDAIDDYVYEIMNHEFLDFYRDKEDTKIEESY